MQFINWILKSSPYPELLIRRIYYQSAFLKRIKQTKEKKLYKKENIVPGLFKKIEQYIKTLGIKKGDILIVHSSMDALLPTGENAGKYIDMLLELVGEEGTLVIPAYPLYKKNRNTNLEENNDILVYNPLRTTCSTGLIPNIFLRYPGVIRSEFPENSLAAKGSHAKEMMSHNLESDLVHGKNSSWEYCINHHAKILFLGVKSNHTTTAVHVAEDLMDSDWPIKDWYEEKQYIIKRTKDEELITVRSRRQFWSRFLISHYRSKIFIKNNLLQEKEINGIYLGYIQDSKKLVDFLIRQAKKGKLFFKVPHKYWKDYRR